MYEATGGLARSGSPQRHKEHKAQRQGKAKERGLIAMPTFFSFLSFFFVFFVPLW
jgi:hypothetical protein